LKDPKFVETARNFNYGNFKTAANLENIEGKLDDYAYFVICIWADPERFGYWFRAQKNIPRNEIATCLLNFQDVMETRDKQKGDQKLFKELRDVVYSEETRPR